MLGGLTLFAIGRRFVSKKAAWIGLAFYSFLPSCVIASRSFQPDPWMVTWILFTAYALLRWAEKPGWKWALAAGVLGGVAILIKVFAAYFIGGILVASAIASLGWKRFFRHPHPWVMGLVMLAPSLVYYLALNPQRSGDFYSFWIVSLSGLIRTTGFYADWLAMIKGLMGLFPLIAAMLGLAVALPKPRALLFGGWIGYVLFGLTFPYQYVTHEYYHLMLYPLVALSLMPLIETFLSTLQRQPIFWKLVVVGALGFASFYGLYVSRSMIYAADYASEPASWARVGKALPEGQPFVALTADYGMRLIYYGWRVPDAVWPSSADLKLFQLSKSLPQDFDNYFQSMTAGKTYFLVTALSEFDAQPQLKDLLNRKYPIFFQGNGFVIYDLVHPLESR
jgi:4-amino-4-deoxy-L-arabinose transferase-like glycosyltransferase